MRVFEKIHIYLQKSNFAFSLKKFSLLLLPSFTMSNFLEHSNQTGSTRDHEVGTYSNVSAGTEGEGGIRKLVLTSWN